MNFIELPLSGAYLVNREDKRDPRGFFARTFCHHELAGQGLDFQIRQCNISMSLKKGTLRGMHFQLPPYSEIKLVSCVKGAFFDCIVDFRENSPTYLQHYAVVLEEFGPALYVPEGFAHGLQTLCDNTIVEYKVSADYTPNSEGGLRWNDPKLGIVWPECGNRTISDKDMSHPLL